MPRDLVLVVDYGAQYAQLIARRVREAHVYSEIVAHTTPVDEMMAREPKAIILSGGPASVYAPGAPQADPRLFAAGVPVFGICYGFQAMAVALGGTVADTGGSEFGRTELTTAGDGGRLLAGMPATARVWMSHGDEVSAAPPGFTVVGSTAGAPVAAFEDPVRRLAGVQFHPEVAHTERGQQVLCHFLHDIAGLRPSWTEASIIDEQVAAIRAQVGQRRAIC
ncbi:MAG: glutamine-hydrolyzing GMP synthase, partial [Actinomycetia bacterium]|nr:glutamine-hydrolyzing GMP synthase [Actinomycetes bacterium]